MMKILNKFAVFIVMGIIGYLAYSSLNGAAAKPAGESKELPVVTEKMLEPVFLDAKDGASPAGRDPFEVSGFGYADISNEADGNENGGGIIDGNNVHFPQKLMGILEGDDGQQLALIGGEVYDVGSFVKQPDSNAVWEVSSIENETVILTCKGLRAVLSILDSPADNKDVKQKMSKIATEKELK
ncbi:MAG: hypothetical protein ABSE89_01295 [Sedimentisphaerales bacterium]